MIQHHLQDKWLDVRAKLLAQRNASGFWTGELSSSALSTAVAIVALKVAGYPADNPQVESGFNWLCRNINADGGFGDTPESPANVSTTLLAYAAISFCKPDKQTEPLLRRTEAWLLKQGIALQSQSITRSILKFYGRDYTFSIPILAMLVVCGILPKKALNNIPGLPFELTLLPTSWYRMVNLRVVSYALPALIGVGIYLHRNKETRIKLGIRNLFVKYALRKLDRILPESGGFLEAIPLTGFVAMCLMKSGINEGRAVKAGIEFLRNQQRRNGGWPIDTDLSTWVTTLSIKALGPELKHVLSGNEIARLRNHLLSLQYKTNHHFNNAPPGGWGWTNYSGSVPDADDTPGALLALLEMFSGSTEEITALENGCQWLTNIQNRDGGFPTFCRGWGRLPFDSSCADLTGHALLAIMKVMEKINSQSERSVARNAAKGPKGQRAERNSDTLEKSIHMAMGYLLKVQSPAGSWLPLWFGNQHTADKTNPVYGTAKVCIYLNDCLRTSHPDQPFMEQLSRMAEKARKYLVSQQNDDGSWGGHKGIPGTIEETSLAISALAGYSNEHCEKGFKWLSEQQEINPSPIGLYFAMLWYHEKLYPLIYYAEALRRIQAY